MGHPLRVRILDVLNVQEASPKELEGILGIDLHHVAYHVRVLKKTHCLELTRTEQRRGATEHYSRALPEASMGHKVLQRVPRALRNSAAVAALKVFVGSLFAALEAGAADAADDAPLSSMTIALDGVGRKDAIGIVENTITQLKRVDEESRQRAGTDEALTPHVVGLALFEAAARPGRADPAGEP